MVAPPKVVSSCIFALMPWKRVLGRHAESRALLQNSLLTVSTNAIVVFVDLSSLGAGVLHLLTIAEYDNVSNGGNGDGVSTEAGRKF